MATCQICKYAGNPKDKPPCSDCKGYSKYEYEKPQTNADSIRAMSDEELAKILVDGFCCNLCKYKDTNRWDCPEECEKCCVEWLKQPAEEVN